MTGHLSRAEMYAKEVLSEVDERAEKLSICGLTAQPNAIIPGVAY